MSGQQAVGRVWLRFESDSVVVVAGVPGAGKTTLIRRAVDRAAVRVVDTEDRRDAGRRRLLSATHYARIAAAIAGRRPVVIHTRGTHAATRRTIALLARLRGRPAHLILLDVGRAEAEAGQRARGRTVDPADMRRHVARWQRLTAHGTGGEGWASVIVLDRVQAERTRAIDFVPAVRVSSVRRRTRSLDAPARHEAEVEIHS
jgi:predicted kinase